MGVVALCVLITSPAEAAAPGPVPWSAGQVIGEGWTLSMMKRHPEFLRLTVTRDEVKGQLEVVPGRPGDPWSTAHYRVQPAPGGSATPESLKAVLAALSAWEQTVGHRPFVGVTKGEEGPAEADTSGPDLPRLRAQPTRAWPPNDRWLWLIGDALLLALLAMCLARGESPRSGLGGLALSLGVGGVVWGCVDPAALPTVWITVLQEGSVAGVVAALYGQGHHGPAFDALRWALGTEGGLPIRDVVAMNLTLTVMNSVAVGAMTWSTTKRASLSLLTAAAWGLTPLQVNAAWSDLPACLVSSYTLIGAVAVANVRRMPLPAMTLLGLVALMLGGVRLEWGVLGVVTWCSLGIALITPATWSARLDRSWTTAALIVAGALMVSLVGVLGAGTSASAPEAWQLWQRQGGGAVGWGAVTWPLGFLATWPVGLTLLACLGGLQVLRRPLSWSAAGVAALVLQGVYWTSAHDGDAPYEVLRYASLMAGLGGALAALGWGIALRGCHGHRRARVIILGLAGLCVLPLPQGGWRDVMEAHHAESPGTLYEMPLSRHMQAEARSLIQATEAHPSCVIATVSAIEPSAERTVSAYEYVFFGGSLVTPQLCDRVPEVFNALLDAVVTGAECVLVHRGLDCHVAGGPDCREEVGGAHFVKGFERLARPYYDHVLRREPVRLELWRRRGP
jgi:hypothetical protein